MLKRLTEVTLGKWQREVLVFLYLIIRGNNKSQNLMIQLKNVHQMTKMHIIALKLCQQIECL